MLSKQVVYKYCQKLKMYVKLWNSYHKSVAAFTMNLKDIAVARQS